MAEQMKLAYEFDFVHDGQQVFREVLSAMSCPGTTKSITPQSVKFAEVYAPLTAMGCTLLDNEEMMYVEKNPKLSAELHNLTLCHPGALEEADYIFLSSEMNYASMKEILKHVKKGTYADPHDSATILILCQELIGTTQMTLKGPGINGTLTRKVNQYIKKILVLRQELQTEYPLGEDLIFTDPKGEILCVPRLCKVLE